MSSPNLKKSEKKRKKAKATGYKAEMEMKVMKEKCAKMGIINEEDFSNMAMLVKKEEMRRRCRTVLDGQRPLVV